MKLRLIPFLILLLKPVAAYSAGIELHAHLFMKEGMGWMFKGSFNDPLQATKWQDRFSSQANPETLEKSDLDIVVASLYVEPLFVLSPREAIRKQLALARRFVQEHPNWVLAEHPDQAKAALSSGKRVLILSLEGISGIIESEEDLKEFIDEGGIRIVTLLHLTDDHFGGVAFLKGFRAFSSPWALFKSLFHPRYDSEGNRLNPQGLTDEGRQMAISLAKRKVWIDLAHASDASQNDLLPILSEARQPLLYTHTSLRKYHRAERGVLVEQLEKLAETGGFVGIMPSEQMLDGTPSTGSCQGSIHALATQFQEISKIVGPNSIGMGSDFNGGIPHLRPSCNTGTSLDKEGLWNIGQSQEVWRALRAEGVGSPGPRGQDNAARFLEAWSQLWGQRNSK